MNELENFWLIMAKEQTEPKGITRAQAKWSPQVKSWVKANWDVATNRRMQKRGTSIIIRDCCGEVLACQASSFAFFLDPVMAECESLWRTLMLCEELGFDRVCLKGDAKVVIDAVHELEECYTWYGTRIEDIKRVFRQHPAWSLVFIHREGNFVVDLFPKFGLSVSDEYVWIEDYPHVIHSTILTNYQ